MAQFNKKSYALTRRKIANHKLSSEWQTKGHTLETGKNCNEEMSSLNVKINIPRATWIFCLQMEEVLVNHQLLSFLGGPR